ncbi:MAG: hypothetical protein OXI67_17960 [Candidatus Poribacteria bacterium]|nr:hypothetical protein [Candidatus Poribacteria bacterium]
MLKSFQSIFVLLLIFGLGVTLLANEWATNYFPDKLGSYWIYADQEGNELTRYAVEEKDVEGETFRAFDYEPEIDDWEKYLYAVHPFLYKVGEEWVAFYVGGDIEVATESILTKKLDETLGAIRQQFAGQLPEGITMDFNYTIEPKAQDYFYLFPTPVKYNEEWIAMRLNVTVKMKMDIQGAPVEIPAELKSISSTTNIVETGNVIGTEVVETQAGTFEDCLKIEYRTKTTVNTTLPTEFKQLLPEQQPAESVTTLWLAPNVGIVKFSSGQENSDDMKTLELKNYEIQTDESESGDSK